jgi:AraC-like DNA-binding protein
MTDDPDLLTELIHGAAIQVEPTAAPRGNIELIRFEGALLSLISGRLEAPILSFGEITSDVVVYALQLSGGEGYWNSSPFDERVLWAYGPGSEHEGVGIHTPWWSAITMSRELAATLNPSDAPDLSRGERRLYAADAVATLAGTIRQANTLIARGATGSFKSDNLEPAVLTELADAFAVGPVETPKEFAADKVVARCIEAASTLGPVPNVAELAEAVGVSSRWVCAAFDRRFGMPPSAWFRVRALHGARRELTSANPSLVSVAEIATKWGFWHLGRFAGTYRRHFGEPPSATLKRPPRQR